jgi:hypothetical protein
MGFFSKLKAGYTLHVEIGNSRRVAMEARAGIVRLQSLYADPALIGTPVHDTLLRMIKSDEMVEQTQLALVASYLAIVDATDKAAAVDATKRAVDDAKTAWDLSKADLAVLRHELKQWNEMHGSPVIIPNGPTL